MNIYHYEFETRKFAGGPDTITGVVLILASTEIEAFSKASVKLETEGLAHQVETLRLLYKVTVPGPADVIYFCDGDY